MLDRHIAFYGQAPIARTLDEATKIHSDFFELYPGLIGYHNQQRAFVKRHEFVRSPLGRVRHLPTIASSDWSVRSKAERQSSIPRCRARSPT